MASRKEIKERKDVVVELLDMTPEEIKQFIKDGINDYVADAKQSIMVKINESRSNANRSEQMAEYHENACRAYVNDVRRILPKYECAIQELKELEPMIERLESVKRQANAVCNNAVIDGFECNMCGCIVKNICVNGQWTKQIIYCPNCGGKNIGIID